MKWGKSPLGDLITLQRGYDLPSQSRRDGVVPVVTSSGITGTHEEAAEHGPGVVTGRYGTIGEVHFIEEDYWPHNTTLFVKDFKGNDPSFVCYLLKSIDLARQVSSGAVPGVNRNVLHAMPVPAVPKRRQKDIADVLRAYDDLIENNRRRMVLLEESARLLYREWFVRLRFPGHEHTRISDRVPDGWTRISIAELVEPGEIDLQTGPFGTQLKASHYTEEGTPVINVRNIGFGDVRPEKLEYLPETVVDRLHQHVLKTGDIVFGRKGAVDRHVLIRSTQHGWVQGSDCIRLRSHSERVSTILLSLAFRETSHKEWMLTQCSNKATMASLNQDVLGRIVTVLPSHSIHREFVELASVTLNQIGVLEAIRKRGACFFE